MSIINYKAVEKELSKQIGSTWELFGLDNYMVSLGFHSALDGEEDISLGSISWKNNQDWAEDGSFINIKYDILSKDNKENPIIKITDIDVQE